MCCCNKKEKKKLFVPSVFTFTILAVHLVVGGFYTLDVILLLRYKFCPWFYPEMEHVNVRKQRVSYSPQRM